MPFLIRSLIGRPGGNEIRAEPDRSAGLRVCAEDRPADRLMASAAQADETNDLALADAE